MAESEVPSPDEVALAISTLSEELPKLLKLKEVIEGLSITTRELAEALLDLKVTMKQHADLVEALTKTVSGAAA